MTEGYETNTRSGYLLEWKRLSNDADWAVGTRFSVVQIAHGWEDISFNATPEEARQFNLPEANTCRVLRRRGNRRFILLSRDKAEIDCALAITRVRWMIVNVRVDIPRLVNALMTAPCDYAIGAAWARVDGYGQKLRTLGMFGEDLTETDLFRKLIAENHVSCFRVALRDVRRAIEVFSISHRGEMSMRYVDEESLLGVQDGIRFLTNSGYLGGGEGEPE